MKLFGGFIQINEGHDLFYDLGRALEKYGSVGALADGLESFQSHKMDSRLGFHSIALVCPRGSKGLMIRLAADKSATQEQGAEFLKSRGIPV